MIAIRWDFNLSVEESQRLPFLIAGTTFPSIVKQIRDSMSILCAHCSEQGEQACTTKEKTAFRRPIYTVSIDPWLFDVFFNSALGYRAAYFRSAGIGLDANAFFMRIVACCLIDSSHTCNTRLPKDFIRESLLSPSAKVWLAEVGNEPLRTCPTCKGEWTTATCGEAAEILNGRWEKKNSYRARWGRRAPYLRKLRIMGAFLNKSHDELTCSEKRYRSIEIHKYGWS